VRVAGVSCPGGRAAVPALHGDLGAAGRESRLDQRGSVGRGHVGVVQPDLPAGPEAGPLGMRMVTVDFSRDAGEGNGVGRHYRLPVAAAKVSMPWCRFAEVERIVPRKPT